MYRDINRFKFKASYQKNMMLAWLPVLFIIIIPAIIFSNYFTEKSGTLIIPSENILTDINYSSGSSSPHNNNRNQQQLLQQDILSKQLFVNVVITSDYSPVVQSPEIEPLEFPILNTDQISDLEIDLNGNENLRFDAKGGDGGTGSSEYFDYHRSKSVNKQCEVIEKEDPFYPQVAEDDGIEGEVAVILYINFDGEKTTFPEQIAEEFRARGYTVIRMKQKKRGGVIQFDAVLVYEQPCDWFFGDNLLKVLPRWIFSPTIEKNQPVASFITIRYNFCLSTNCDKIILKQNKNSYLRRN